MTCGVPYSGGKREGEGLKLKQDCSFFVVPFEERGHSMQWCRPSVLSCASD